MHIRIFGKTSECFSKFLLCRKPGETNFFYANSNVSRKTFFVIDETLGDSVFPDHNDAERSVLSFVRKGSAPDDFVVIVCNFTPSPQPGYRLGVPKAGVYRERINTDSAHYGGSNAGNAFGEVQSQDVPWHGRAHSIEIAAPPLAAVIFDWRAA